MDAKEQLNAIREIRSMMNKSTRFLSLSGLSGVFAGIYALVACGVAYKYLGAVKYSDYKTEDRQFFILVGLVTLVLALLTAYFFTRKNAKKDGVKMWDENVKVGLINLAIPLLSGGILSLALLYNELFALLAPCTLIFYGLALVSASRNTVPVVRQLGLLEIILGLINAFFLGYGMIFWLLGFGVLHIVYGIIMQYKYQKA
ncbi:MAG: hypothetical protein ACPF8V_08415 [Luteibaculum sp.]